MVDHSKFGPTLVISTHPRGGAHLFGFRVEPAERMEKLQKEVTMLRWSR